MKIRKILCIAAAFCLLWTMAAADGTDYSTINLTQYSAVPYHWEAQLRNNGDEMTWRIKDLFDGVRSTRMEHLCWHDESLDDIPEISFYFSGVTIKDIWIRNRYDDTDEEYVQYARPYRLEITVWTGSDTEPYGPYIFTKMSDECNPEALNQDWMNSYRRLALPETFENVTRVDLWIKGWHKGNDLYKTKYTMMISDMAFLPDAPENLIGSQYNPSNYYWTQAPMGTPSTTSSTQSQTTAAPATGLQVLTKDRLATRSGPGTNYTETGSYFQSGKWVKAISSAYDTSNGIWWVQVELDYNGELRRVYTGVKRLQMSADQVAVEEAPEYSATLTRSVYGYWGPGYSYSMYGDKIPAGTWGQVWQSEGLYAQFEYYDTSSQQYRRVWVPTDALESGGVG